MPYEIFFFETVDHTLCGIYRYETLILFKLLLGLITLAADGQDKSTAKETATKPMACKLTTPELQKRKATVIAELRPCYSARKSYPTGIAMSLKALTRTSINSIPYQDRENVL